MLATDAMRNIDKKNVISWKWPYMVSRKRRISFCFVSFFSDSSTKIFNILTPKWIVQLCKHFVLLITQLIFCLRKKKIKSKFKFLVNDGVSMRPHVCGVNIQMWISILKVKIGICLKLWTNQFHQIKCFNGMCDGALQSKAILQTLFNMNFSEGPLKCNILHWAFAHLPLLIRLHVGAHEPLR